jgi:phage gp29-like protein
MAAQPRILGPDGEPIRRQDLLREIATPSVEGIRNFWADSVASGLTPDALADLLRATPNGDADAFLTLAEEMEERDLHYLGVLGSRKRALSGLEVTVESASDDAFDVKLAEESRDLVLAPSFEDTIEDLQDALGKSYSVSEIIWDTSAGQWQPMRYEWKEPRWFKFDIDTRQELRLKDAVDPLRGIALAPYKFLQHRPRIKKGLPIRNGFARIIAFMWIMKLYALKDWMAFAEVFGMPLRLGRYGPNASREDVSVLKRAVANIGSDAAAVLPDSMRIEFEAAANVGGAAQLFEGLCTYLDKQVSKAVLGQTMTTDDGSSLSQAQVHNEVRLDILKADAKDMAQTLNRDLIKPFVDLNHGVQKRYPRVTLKVIEPEDIKALVESLDKLVPMGLRVEESTMLRKLGLPEPPEKTKDGKAPRLLQPAGSTLADPALNAQHRGRSLNMVSTRRDELDELVDAGLQDWQQQMEPMIGPIEKLAAECGSFDEFLSRIPELIGQIDSEQLQLALATWTYAGRALGDARDLKD